MTTSSLSPISSQAVPSNKAHDADEASPASTPRVRKPRGFAAMDPKKVSEIAKKGGRAAHEAGTAHRFTSTEAREAGRKGGLAPHKRRKSED
jgi:uncharacterized protein